MILRLKNCKESIYPFNIVVKCSLSSNKAKKTGTGLIEYQAAKGAIEPVPTNDKTNAIVPRKAVKFPKPEWHAPWKLMKV